MADASIPESTPFDNCLDKVSSLQSESSILADMLGMTEEDDDTNPNHWTKHWKGMPEYVQEKKESYKTLYVHFRTEEDYEKFAILIQQPLTENTKSIWYPALVRDENRLMRWIEEE